MERYFSNRLLLLPLFQGFSRLDFLDIVEHVRFDLQSLKAGSVVVRQDEECRALVFIISGEVWLTRESYDHRFTLRERVAGPAVLQPEVLFGLHNRYKRSVEAVDKVQIMQLDKEAVRELLLRYPTFQLNFYNLICSVAQNADWQLWNARSVDLRKRFVSFVRRRSYRPNGMKELRIKMTDLGDELGATRLNVSRMLGQLQKENMVTLHRGRIIVTDLAEIK